MLTVVDRSGHEHVLQRRAGQTVMEIIRDAGLDELTALCGGCCSCATCHVHVDPVSFDALAPMSDDERAMLEDSAHFSEYSRLSCQLRLHEGVSQLRVTISQDD